MCSRPRLSFLIIVADTALELAEKYETVPFACKKFMAQYKMAVRAIDLLESIGTIREESENCGYNQLWSIHFLEWLLFLGLSLYSS